MAPADTGGVFGLAELRMRRLVAGGGMIDVKWNISFASFLVSFFFVFVARFYHYTSGMPHTMIFVPSVVPHRTTSTKT